MPFMFARAPAAPISSMSFPLPSPRILSAISTNSMNSSIGCQLMAMAEM